MLKYIKFQNMNNGLKTPDGIDYQVYISFVTAKDDYIGESIYELEEFLIIYNQIKPAYILLYINNQEELDYIIPIIIENTISLKLQLYAYKNFDLSCLKNLNNLETIDFYWNNKQTKLWDISKNKKLRHFEMMDYNKITDFSLLANSNIETLKLYGCNNCSSFNSKLHINDLSFLLKMKKLKRLCLDIVKDYESNYYLDIFSQLKNLEYINLTYKFFTFEEYAYLSANLSNTFGLEAYFYFKHLNQYLIIGKNAPKLLKNKEKAEEYKLRYEELKKSFKI